MNVLITGHRIQKLEAYDHAWMRRAIEDVLIELKAENYVGGLSGMASGVDLWFCETCLTLEIPYTACIPFEGQEETMSTKDGARRHALIEKASAEMHIRNSAMVERADIGIVVWDGNKGGTHNVVQQLVETKKGFYWINPVGQVIWKCL